MHTRRPNGIWKFDFFFQLNQSDVVLPCNIAVFRVFDELCNVNVHMIFMLQVIVAEPDKNRFARWTAMRSSQYEVAAY